MQNEFVNSIPYQQFDNGCDLNFPHELYLAVAYLAHRD
jgi:hypothetical protein